MILTDLGALHDDAVVAITELAEANPDMTLAGKECLVADAVLRVLLDPESLTSALVAAVAGMLARWPGDRFETLFTVSDGTLWEMSAGPVLPEPGLAAQQRKTKNLALIALSQEYPAEFRHLRDGFEAEFGAPVPAARRRP